MRIFAWLLLIISLSSCWKLRNNSRYRNPEPYKIVWGNKAIYGVDTAAKKITYSNAPQTVLVPGNIYVKGNYIYQAEVGKGLHVIDNTIPANAHRIGFITINGCSQISIKGNNLYSNNYDDLVVIDIANTNSVREVGRIKGAFPDGRRNYYYIQPIESGYYECPRYDSMIIGWRKDSVPNSCFKN